MNDYKCSVNGCDLKGEKIPEDYSDHYYDTHFSKAIGIQIRGYYDGMSFYKCPECGGMWCRFTGKTVKDEQDGIDRKLGRPDSR